MTIARGSILLVAASLTAHADFSFTMTQKSGPGNGQVVKHMVKGDRELEDRGRTVTILDFGVQTLTIIDRNAKTYKVTRFSDLENAAGAVDVQADVHNTGLRKVINGFNASQIVMMVQVDTTQGLQEGFKGQVETELWISPDVPGSRELVAFYKRNAAHWPIAAMGANPGMQKAMAKLQQQFAEMDGVPVMEIIRTKSAGTGAAGGQSSQMEQARARLEEVARGGGPGAAAAQQALDRLNAMSGGSGSLFDITIEAGNFSSAPVPDSAFAIPAGYQKVEK